MKPETLKTAGLADTTCANPSYLWSNFFRKARHEISTGRPGRPGSLKGKSTQSGDPPPHLGGYAGMPPQEAGSRSFADGPVSTLPKGSKRDPWHGQFQVAVLRFHETIHPKCGQMAERRCS